MARSGNSNGPAGAPAGENVWDKAGDYVVLALVGSALLLGALVGWFRYGTTSDLKEAESRD